MSKTKQNLGRWGEKVATTYLEANHFKIRHRNWRCRHGEIDIVAWRDGKWHFIEVKARRGRAVGSPEEAITTTKARRLQALVGYYIGAFDLNDIEWQIDLVAIEVAADGTLLRCEHIEHFVYG